jgi:hypothetical protein
MIDDFSANLANGNEDKFRETVKKEIAEQRNYNKVH